MSDRQSLLRLLGYQFADPALLEQALTHRSCGARNNERLEFLGDSILNFLIAEALFQRHPDLPEGQLSRLRSQLVKGDTLAELAQDFGLGEHLLLGPGERKSGGFRRKSILADTVEALIGAIYLEAGIDPCRERVLAWFGPRLAEASPGEATKDAKSRLQELLQGRKLPLPSYQVIDESGDPHQRTFTVSCHTALLTDPEIARAHSRREAEQRAAQAALDRIAEHDL